MQKHEVFDLLIHSSDELAALLGEPIVERQALHGWPFSAVERLTTVSDTRWIYKAQHAPTVEPEFYAAVRSPLLPAYRTLHRDAVYASMLFAFVDAPLLQDLTLSEAELVAHGRALVAAIGQMRQDVPVYIDISSIGRWRDFVASTLDLLTQLVTTERLVLSVAQRDVDEVARWTESDAVRRLIERTSRLTHGDLTSSNVFVTASGYQVIDWQRPQLAPAQVDLAALLEHTPYLFRHVEPAAIGVFYFLHLFWAVHAKANLLPELEQLFDWWTSEAIGYIRRAAEAAG